MKRYFTGYTPTKFSTSKTAFIEFDTNNPTRANYYKTDGGHELNEPITLASAIKYVGDKAWREITRAEALLLLPERFRPKSISYTFTREELWNAVRAALLSTAHDLVQDALDCGDLDVLRSYSTVRYNYNAHIQYWRDLLSEKFFAENPNITDVLVGEDKDKTWMASR